MSLYISLDLLLAVSRVPSLSPLFINESIQPLYKTKAMGLRQVAAAIVSAGASWNEMRHFTKVNRMARVGRHTLRVPPPTKFTLVKPQLGRASGRVGVWPG